MQISQDIQNRIIEVAEQLHAQNPDKMPTVADVRAASKADMNSVSTVMKLWRQNKLMPQKTIAEEAPAEVLAELKTLAATIWTTAKTQAEEKLRDVEAQVTKEREESEALRQELATECDILQKSLDDGTEAYKQAITAQERAERALQDAFVTIAQLQEEKVQAENTAALAQARNFELDKHVDTLKTDIMNLQKTVQDVKTQSQADKQEYTAELTTAQATIAQRDYTITELQTQLQALQQARDAEITRLTAEATTLTSEVKTLTTKVQDTEKALIQAKADTDIAKATADQAQKHAQDLKQILDNMAEESKTKRTRQKPQ